MFVRESQMHRFTLTKVISGLLILLPGSTGLDVALGGLALALLLKIVNQAFHLRYDMPCPARSSRGSNLNMQLHMYL